MPADSTSERRSLFYHGTVQGVGFRYTARHIARSFRVSGYVRNLPNGEVELTVEGTKEALDRFLSAVARAMEGCIGGSRVRTGPATGEFEAFEIRF